MTVALKDPKVSGEEGAQMLISRLKQTVTSLISFTQRLRASCVWCEISSVVPHGHGLSTYKSTGISDAVVACISLSGETMKMKYEHRPGLFGLASMAFGCAAKDGKSRKQRNPSLPHRHNEVEVSRGPSR